MKPIEESTVIRRSIEDVFDYLDVLANHESFNDHYLVDWELRGPATGVGAAVHMRAKAPGGSECVELTVVEAERPVRSVEETVGVGGRRRTRGTYTLAARDAETTDVRFTLTPVETPPLERLLWPLSQAWLGRQLRRALERLRDQLEQKR